MKIISRLSYLIFFSFCFMQVAYANEALVLKKTQALSAAEQLLQENHKFNAADKEAWPKGLSQLSEQLQPEGQDLAWTFEQYRYLKLLKKPISTSGALSVTLSENDLNVLWQVLKPVPSEFAVEGGKVKQRKNGKWKNLKTAEQPAFVFVSKVMNQAMLGDFSALGEHFALFWQNDNLKAGTPWQVGMKPKDSSGQLQEMIAYIRLQGVWGENNTAAIEQLMVVDAREEVSLIDLQAKAQ